ncbi:MAG: hypothetical protein ABEJ58_09425 [Halodesulfurarchaeum sp.]
MTEGNERFQATEHGTVEDVGWTAAQSMLHAQATGYRAMEDYMLLLYHDRMEHIGESEVHHLLADAIDAHREIIEDLECAREALGDDTTYPTDTTR